MASVTDLFLIYSFIKRLANPFNNWKAFKAGIIDAEGNILKPRSTLNWDERSVFGYFDLLILNLKKMLAKLPGGSSRIATFAAAMLLLKEENGFNAARYSVLSENLGSELKSLMEGTEIKMLLEDEGGAPSTNTGNVAGIEAPLVKGKFKVLKRKVPQIEEALLLESQARIDALKAKYKAQIEKWLMDNEGMDFDEDDPETGFDFFFDSSFTANDPTTSKIYLDWIIRLFLKNLVKDEDLYKIRLDLVVFDRLKHTQYITDRDINSYKTPLQLYNVVNSLRNIVSNKEEKKDENAAIKKDIIVVYQGPLGSIVIPKTWEASQYLGRGTRWCTAMETNRSWFDRYTKTGPLFVFTYRNGAKYQFHMDMNGPRNYMFMNIEDHRPDNITTLINDELFQDVFLTKMWEYYRKPSHIELLGVVGNFLHNRNKVIERMIIETGQVQSMLDYCDDDMRFKPGERWLEVEPIFCQPKNFIYGYLYCTGENPKRAPFKELERAMIKHGRMEQATWSYLANVKKDVWPEIEKIVLRNGLDAYKYTLEYLKRPFPAAEHLFAKDSYLSLMYAQNVLKAKFPLGEPAIMSHGETAKAYKALFRS